MNETTPRYARAWQLSSTILLALAITALTWAVSALGLFILDWADIINQGSESSLILAIVISLITLVTFLSLKWHSRGSSTLYITELILGGLLFLGGAIYAYYGHVLGKAHVSTGWFSGIGYMFMMIIGIYVACVGTLIALAGFLGMLSQPRMRELHDCTLLQ